MSPPEPSFQPTTGLVKERNNLSGAYRANRDPITYQALEIHESHSVGEKNGDYHSLSLGVGGRRKAYIGSKKFAGNWQEYLEGCSSVFETMAGMCKLSDVKGLEAVVIMLEGDALRLFSDKVGMFQTFRESSELLREHYHSPENIWHIIGLGNDEPFLCVLNESRFQ